MKKEEFPELYGWDDGSIYFMDENNKEWCVTDEKELYHQLVRLCTEYFKRKLKEGNIKKNENGIGARRKDPTYPYEPGKE